MSEQYNRLVWHSRRSSLELDILLTRYIEKHYTSLSADLISDYEKLLEVDDIKLQQWLVHKQTAEPPYQRIVNHILASCQP